LILLASACSARETTPSSVGAAAGASAASGPDYDAALVTVPFLVDDEFIPSGCMGDCVATVTIDSNCPTRGASDAQGECHHFVYAADTAPGALGWAGVLWQTVEQNWGSQSGRAIEPGVATSMSFDAMATTDGVALTILVGGMNASDGGKACSADTDCASDKCVSGACSAPLHDTLNLSAPEVLSSNWQAYSIPFGTSSYGSQVLSGFGWTAVMPASSRTLEFYVDNLRWE
jgi:hypothetical protein